MENLNNLWRAFLLTRMPYPLIKKWLFNFYVTAGCLLFLSFTAQTQHDPLIGTWKGTSLCQVKNSPCNDEIAVYHAKKSSGSYSFQMNKMVAGKEEEMGILEFTFDGKAKTLTASSIGGKKGFWKFKLSGNMMHGTLTLEDGTLYRIIDVTKVD